MPFDGFDLITSAGDGCMWGDCLYRFVRWILFIGMIVVGIIYWIKGADWAYWVLGVGVAGMVFELVYLWISIRQGKSSEDIWGGH